jgi:acetyltransferase-like isoleucine patch superfamily enzyme
MESISFTRLITGAKGELLNPSDLSIRVLWFEQRDRYLKFLQPENRTRENLEKVFNLLGKPENIDSLRVDMSATLPFAGDMFSRTTIGHNVTICPEALMLSHGGLTLGDGAVIGSKSLLVTLGHPTHPTQRHLHKMGPIAIGDNVLLGSGSVVVNSGKAEPVRIGEGSITLPGTAITKDIPDYCVVNGANKIVLQGEQHFKPVNALNAHECLSMQSRLTPEGLRLLAEALPEQDLKSDLTKSLDQPLSPDAKIYTVKSIAPSDALFEFFSQTPRETLRICLVPGPVTVEGEIPVLKERMTLNQGSFIHTDPGGKINFQNWDLLAPRAKVISKNGGVVNFDPEVWVGAGTSIVADGKAIKIGRGSILASGAVITDDVPEWSVVVTGSKVVKSVSEDDIVKNLPEEWTKPALYYEAFASNSDVAKKMTPDERVAWVNERVEAIRAQEPARLKAAGCSNHLHR